MFEDPIMIAKLFWTGAVGLILLVVGLFVLVSLAAGGPETEGQEDNADRTSKTESDQEVSE